jgi:hypothetical protein
MTKLFDAKRYPKLRRVGHDDRYGRMELVDVRETGDGFLIGQAWIGRGRDRYLHSVFLGRADNFRPKP